MIESLVFKINIITCVLLLASLSWSQLSWREKLRAFIAWAEKSGYSVSFLPPPTSGHKKLIVVHGTSE